MGIRVMGRRNWDWEGINGREGGIGGAALGEGGRDIRRKRGEAREERWAREAMLKVERARKGDGEAAGQKACGMRGALRGALAICQAGASGKWKTACAGRRRKSASRGAPDWHGRFP